MCSLSHPFFPSACAVEAVPWKLSQKSAKELTASELALRKRKERGERKFLEELKTIIGCNGALGPALFLVGCYFINNGVC